MIKIRGCSFPLDRYYHADYNVWVQPGANGVVTLGATSYGAALAVEFFAFTPKAIGTKVDVGRAVGVLELSKTVVSVRAPVAGVVLEVNTAAVAKPEIIGADPYGTGWLVQLTAPWNETIANCLLSEATLAPAFEAEMALDNFQGPLAI